GIRDGHVTGVQTCALPICPVRLRLWPAGVLRDQTVHQIEHDFLRDERVRIDLRNAIDTESVRLCEAPPVVNVWDRHVVKATGNRSEERRVGKGCRCGVSLY